jgi:hypothetical protein
MMNPWQRRLDGTFLHQRHRQFDLIAVRVGLGGSSVIVDEESITKWKKRQQNLE